MPLIFLLQFHLGVFSLIFSSWLNCVVGFGGSKILAVGSALERWFVEFRSGIRELGVCLKSIFRKGDCVFVH